MKGAQFARFIDIAEERNNEGANVCFNFKGLLQGLTDHYAGLLSARQSPNGR